MSEVPHIHEPVAGFCGALDSDEELVQSARSGSKTALVELWRRHSSSGLPRSVSNCEEPRGR